MKRKVVVTMSLAYWVDDDAYGHLDQKVTDETVIEEAYGLDEEEIIEIATELNIIKVEITETKQ